VNRVQEKRNFGAQRNESSMFELFAEDFLSRPFGQKTISTVAPSVINRFISSPWNLWGSVSIPRRLILCLCALQFCVNVAPSAKAAQIGLTKMMAL